MKLLYVLVFASLFSCEKKLPNAAPAYTEDPCFIVSHGINFDGTQAKYKPPSRQEILRRLPKHIKINPLLDFETFRYDAERSALLRLQEHQYFQSSAYQEKYDQWIQALPGFQFLATTENYALAKNKYGLWLVVQNGLIMTPYFLSFTQNYFIKEETLRNVNFLSDNQVTFTGSVVGVQRLSRVPMLPKYEVIQDGVRFSIALEEILKDTDHDGFNDLFEDFIGLNANSKDTDGDGIADFYDTNPKFKSGEHPLTSMYEQIADGDKDTSPYIFTEILTDCPHFQKIEPEKSKVLLYGTAEKAPLKDDILDTFFPRKYSKLKTYKNYPDIYFMDFSDKSGDGTLSAEHKSGKWKIDKKYTLTFGV